VSIDGFCVRGYHGVGRQRVLPTPPAWERVAGFGQQANPPRCSLRSGPPARKGGGLGNGKGRLKRDSCFLPYGLCEHIHLSAQHGHLLEVCAYFSIVVPEVGVAPGLTGFLRRAATRFSLSQDCRGSHIFFFFRSTDTGIMGEKPDLGN